MADRKFVIKADLKDDLGLKSLKIVIPEFYLDKPRFHSEYDEFGADDGFLIVMGDL